MWPEFSTMSDAEWRRGKRKNKNSTTHNKFSESNKWQNIFENLDAK